MTKGPSPAYSPVTGPSVRGGWGIRTPEGLHPTRFPSVRHRPLGESSRPQEDTGVRRVARPHTLVPVEWAVRRVLLRVRSDFALSAASRSCRPNSASSPRSRPIAAGERCGTARNIRSTLVARDRRRLSSAGGLGRRWSPPGTHVTDFGSPPWARGPTGRHREQGAGARRGWQRRARGAPRRRHPWRARTPQGVRRRQRGRPAHAEPDGHASGLGGGPLCPGGALATRQRPGA